MKYKDKIKLENHSRIEDKRHQHLRDGFEEYAERIRKANERLNNCKNRNNKKDFKQLVSKQKAQIDRLNTSREYADAIKKIDIDNNRQKYEVKKLLKALETEVVKCAGNCAKCAYRDYETCGCWYTMTHNSGVASTRLKEKHISKKCNHFVDALKFIEERKKLKWQNQ